ncbi:unnamed protein product [Angiostrongylus costaricensis]|uniref:ethanolamine kinase n=1 Tax=Angiostrongylus costaricensis TaxID=334426 RepID=A0A158PL81_ANGCS|nr:unnamed protein product [Angiostrongylus costaricensis]
MFMDRLRTAQPNSACVMEFFDVTALYTNVSNDSTMQAIFELLLQHEEEINIYGFKIEHLMVLLKDCLSCSNLRWSGKYYAQIRGLAMGQRLAPSLAIAFMSKVEAPVTEVGPLLYCRDRELKAMEKLARNHLAAPLHARFINGIVCGYLPGSTITVDDLTDPSMQKYEYGFFLPFVVPNIDFVGELPNQLKKIQAIVSLLEEEITFCHNDLLVHNILFDPVSERVLFIDYEYADYNYTIFDLANLLCEFAGVENPDYSRCPDQDGIRGFLRIYLKERYGRVDEKRLNQMTDRCPLFQAVSGNDWLYRVNN